jgi:hypothetical protein
MAFLDNSGDIILDAVLTDTGRMRLAKADGSFKIQKFALGDDEINYELYDYTNPSGSAYFDLEIMQTPVLEAFTNNMSQLHSKLLTVPRTNLLYLPILMLNQVSNLTVTKMHSDGVFYVGVDFDTITALGADFTGLINGSSPKDVSAFIRVDQGLDTARVSPSLTLDASLVETQYLVEMDSRLGQAVDKSGNTLATISYIDDDQVASYYLSLGTDPRFVTDNDSILIIGGDGQAGQTTSQVIRGPRGTIFEMGIQASLDLLSSTYYFNLIGSEKSIAIAGGSTVDCYVIDSNVRITGVTTGYRMDIPVRYVKKKN